MYAHVERRQRENKVVANSITQKKGNVKQRFSFADNRHAAVAQRKLQNIISNKPKSNVIQKRDRYIPDEDEPHIHVHRGGITFTGIGHRHRDLVVGDQVRQGVINEVIADLRAMGDARSLEIVEWIQSNT